MFNIDRIMVSMYVKRHQGSVSEMEPTCSQTEIRKEKCKAQAYETFNNDDKMAKVRKKSNIQASRITNTRSTIRAVDSMKCL